MTHPGKSMDFSELCVKVGQGEKRDPFMGSLLSIDPGETTGVAFFNHGDLKEASQERTKKPTDALKVIYPIILECTPQAIVVEEYRVYGWKAKDHAWSDMHTSQLIGGIKTIAMLNNETPLFMQSAQIAKQFCTDEKLHEWNFWQKGKPHARDAIRHGCYFILFGKRKGLENVTSL